MIVITTPTGQIGRYVVDELLAKGEALRLVVRDASSLPDDIRARVEVVEGSHADADVAMRAFDGADTVFYVVPPAPQAASVRGHYLAFAEAAAPAIIARGVKRVVAVSTLGLGYAKEAGHLSAALEAEPVITATGVDYRSLGMVYFMENMLNQVGAIKGRGMFFLPNAADTELLTIATSDIGRVAADLLADASWTGQETLPVVGPDRLTPTQMATVISEVLDRPVQFQEVSTDAYKATLLQYGMSEAWVQGLADMATAQNDGIYEVPTRDLSNVTPTSFRAWCEKVLKPAVLA